MSNLIDLPPDRAMPESRVTAREHRILRYATGGIPRQRSRRRAARYAAILAGASVLLVGGTAVGYVAFRPATVPVADEVRCYTVASLEDGDDFPGTTVSQGGTGPGGTADPLSAVEACAGMWRDGFLALGEPGLNLEGCVEGGPCPPPDRPVQPIPPLVACTLDSGIAAVFPGDAGTCADLGLPELLE